MAREAVNLTPTVHGIIPPYSYFKNQLNNVTYKLWADEWTQQPTCRLSKNFLPFPCKRKSIEILRLSRSQMKRMLELITGQNYLNYVQSKIYPGIVSKLCRFCEDEQETFAHLSKTEGSTLVPAKRELTPSSVNASTLLSAPIRPAHSVRD